MERNVFTDSEPVFNAIIFITATTTTTTAIAAATTPISSTSRFTY